MTFPPHQPGAPCVPSPPLHPSLLLPVPKLPARDRTNSLPISPPLECSATHPHLSPCATALPPRTHPARAGPLATDRSAFSFRPRSCVRLQFRSSIASISSRVRQSTPPTRLTPLYRQSQHSRPSPPSAPACRNEHR